MSEKEKKGDIMKSIPVDGFIKIPKAGSAAISSRDRVLLVRKGNELINNGQIDQARRVFLTIGYSAGLIRLGDYYMENGMVLEALKMYKAASAKGKVESMTEKMAGVIRMWLEE